MSKQRGSQAEQNVAEQLRRAGHRIIDTNVHSRFGEIDILSEQHGTLVVTEVKARSNTRYGSPAEFVTPQKQQKIIRCLKHFLNRHPVWHTVPIRFDVACVTLRGDNMYIDIIEAAFEAY